MKLLSNYEGLIKLYARQAEEKTAGMILQFDAEQELKLELWRSADRYDPQKGDEKTFFISTLYRYHKNIIKNTIRRNIRRISCETEWYFQSIQYSQSCERNHIFWIDIIQSIASPRLKTILQLYREGYSQQEIGENMGLSRKTINKELKRVRSFIQEVCNV